jgi:hypothetical protein
METEYPPQSEGGSRAVQPVIAVAIQVRNGFQDLRWVGYRPIGPVICAVTAVAKPIPISSFMRALSPIPRVLPYAGMLTGPHVFGAHRARYE